MRLRFRETVNLRRGFEPGELAGYLIVGGFLFTLAVLMLLAGTGTIDDVAWWFLSE